MKYNLDDCKRVDGCSVVNVLVVMVLRGEGTKDDPGRTVYKYYSTKGDFLFELDNWKDKNNLEYKAKYSTSV